MRSAFVCFIAIAIFSAGTESWIVQEGGTKARLRGVSAVNSEVAWASGTKGTCVRTVDGGATWKPVVVPDSATLDFRDVHATDASTAFLLSIGEGPLSRIYKTTDAGQTWTMVHQNRDPKGFLDAISFWDADHGLAMGDPVDGRYVILTTDDAGKTWDPIPASGMPPSLPGEGAFAASGTCLAVEGTQNAWFATGGGPKSRVFRSTDRGRTWAVAETPISAAKPSRGIFSVAFRDGQHGIIVGGDYKQVGDYSSNLAFSADGGKTWTMPGQNRPMGFRSAVAYRRGLEWITVGPSGSEVSIDDGKTWVPLTGEGFDALSLIGDDGWAVGEGGRIARFARSGR